MRQQGWLETLDWSALPTADETMLDASATRRRRPRERAQRAGRAASPASLTTRLVPGGKIEAFADLGTPSSGPRGDADRDGRHDDADVADAGRRPQTATLTTRRARRTSCWNSGPGHRSAVRGTGLHRRSRQQEQLASMAWSGDVFYYQQLGGAPDLEFVVPRRAARSGPDRCRSRCRPSTLPTRTRSWTSTTAPRLAAMVTDWCCT